MTRTFVHALGSPNYFNHDAACGCNVHNAAISLLGFSHEGFDYDYQHAKHLVLYGRNLIESIKVKEAKAFTAAVSGGLRVTYIDPRAGLTATKATRYWQVRPNSDYALNLAIIHEILERQAYDKEFVARYVSGMDYLAEVVKETTPEWQEQHTGVSAAELRAFVDEIAADAPHVIFHPGWMTARHKQSFYVSRTALILNVLMGNFEIPGGLVLRKTPADFGRKGLKHLVDRTPKVEQPARGRRRNYQATLGPQDRHAAPGLRGHGDRSALPHRRLLRLPPRSFHRYARSRGHPSAPWSISRCSSPSTCAIRRQAGSPM